MRRRSQLIIAIAALAVLSVTAAIFDATRPPALHVSVAAVTRGEISRKVLSSGVLEPTTGVDVGSQVSGTIQSLSADFNDRVKAGQIIAQIDPAPYDTRLAEARAELIRAEAGAEQRRVELEDLRTKASRAVELEVQALITQAELDAAQFAVRQAEAELNAEVAAMRAAKAGVAEAEVNRSRTTIRAPMGGIVVSRDVEVGQTIAASFNSPVLFRIADLRKMRLLADVGEAEAGEVQPGTPVTFEIESIGPRQFSGRISEVRLSPVLAQGTATATASGGSATAGAVPTSGTTSTASSRGVAATGGSGSRGTVPTGSAVTAPGTSTQPATTAAASAPAGSVVSYTAVVDVDNSDGEIVPGGTAVVMLPTGSRADALRVPNAALAFRPSADLLRATGQAQLTLPDDERKRGAAAERRDHIWKYEGGKFVPIAVATGVADERWTEATAGEIQPGDQLVTQAAVSRR